MSEDATRKTDSRAREIARLARMRDDEIDTSDIPERRNWKGGEVGKFYKPIKKQITLRIDADVLEWFKAQDGKYQSSINAALREHVVRQAKGRRA